MDKLRADGGKNRGSDGANKAMAALICGIQPGEDALFRSLSVNMSHFIICTQTGNSSYTTTALTHVGCITMAQKPARGKKKKHQKGRQTCPAIHLHTHPRGRCDMLSVPQDAFTPQVPGTFGLRQFSTEDSKAPEASNCLRFHHRVPDRSCNSVQ